MASPARSGLWLTDAEMRAHLFDGRGCVDIIKQALIVDIHQTSELSRDGRAAELWSLIFDGVSAEETQMYQIMAMLELRTEGQISFTPQPWTACDFTYPAQSLTPSPKYLFWIASNVSQPVSVQMYQRLACWLDLWIPSLQEWRDLQINTDAFVMQTPIEALCDLKPVAYAYEPCSLCIPSDCRPVDEIIWTKEHLDQLRDVLQHRE